MKTMLRFITAGSVDDGKSTLIGRLLHDSKSIFEDQLSAMEKTTKRRGLQGIDLSLLTDGLQAEREQGITIDVAYRYFSTPKRKFIIADTPGHEQYTRNMVTGASTANLAIILIDARRGVLTQTKRHAYLASLVGIPHLVVAVNKMDLVGYSKEAFESIVAEFSDFAARLDIEDIVAIPMSALEGDNVVEKTENMPWYEGETLLSVLENVEREQDIGDFRFPVQWVCRPGQGFRGYMGRIESGSVAVGDEIAVLPSGRNSRIREIHTFDGPLLEAVAPQSVTLLLEEELDISRGDMIVKRDNQPKLSRTFEAMLCWLSEEPLDAKRKYLIKHGTRTSKIVFEKIDYRVNVNSLEQESGIASLSMNDIARVGLRAQHALAADSYAKNRATGSFILIDEFTNNTVAAGMMT